MLDLRLQHSGAAMTCPNCRCPACKAAAVNAVLVRVVVSRETDSELRKAFELLPGGRRFVERRDIGKPPVDPDAEQLAADVVLEHARAG